MGQPHQGHVSLDVSALPAERRFAAWAAALPSYHVSTPDPLAFTAKVAAWRVPPLNITDTRLSPVCFVRTRTHIEADGLDDITAQLFLSGHGAGVADGRPFIFAAGDIAVQDRARPLDVVGAGGRSITVMAPRAFFEGALPAADIHGLVLRGPETELLRGFLRALPDIMRQEDTLDAADIARLTRDLLAATLRQAAAPDGAPGPAALRLRVRRYIAENLTAALDAAAISAALGVSRSSLYRAMARDGGVATAIQRQRLARVHWMLSDPAERRSITALAALHGFVDRAHFGRLFRRVYGCPPKAVRTSAPGPRPRAEQGSVQEQYLGWAEAGRAEARPDGDPA